MTMPNFELEEWEWPPGVERRYLVEPFQSECLATYGLTRITLCVVPHFLESSQSHQIPILFFRPELWQPHLDLSWFQLEDGVPLPNYALACNGALVEQISSLNPAAIEASLQESFGVLSSGARYFKLAGGQCYLFSDFGRWYQDEDPTDIWVNPTLFRIPSNLHRQSSEAVYRWLNAQWADDDSELRFAAHWYNLPSPQIREAIFQMAPQLPQWQRVMQAVTDSEVPATAERLQWSLTLRHEPEEGNTPANFPAIGLSLSSRVLLFPLLKDATNPALNARLLLWGNLLLRHLSFSITDENTMPLCLWRTYQNSTNSFQALSKPISAHEQLEARLFLREWVQGKATPEEMKILFSATQSET